MHDTGHGALEWGSPCPPEALRALGCLPAEPFLLLLPFLVFSVSSAALGRQWPSVLSMHTQKRCAMGPRQNLLLVRFSHSFVTESSLPAESHSKPLAPYVEDHRWPSIFLVHTQNRSAMAPRQNLLLMRFSHFFVTESPLPATGQAADSGLPFSLADRETASVQSKTEHDKACTAHT